MVYMFGWGVFLRQTILKQPRTEQAMAYDTIIMRCGEMFLKSGNLPYFEHKLLQNTKAITGISTITKLRGRLILPYFPHHYTLRRVFGISSYSPALQTEKSLEAIQEGVAAVLNEKPVTTFKIETTRSDKTFPLESRAVNIQVGQYIEKNTAWQCDFHAPHILVKIEINRKGAYVFTEVIPGLGGLPVGTAGKVQVLIENDADILAGLLMMKRGCTVIPLMVGRKRDISWLQKFSPTKIKPRRFETKSELVQYLQQHQVPVLVTGENFEGRKKHPAEVMVLRPLIAYNQKQMSEEIQKFEVLA